MNNNTNMNIYDELSFADASNIKHGLRGHVQIFRQNIATGETSLWEESDNIIPISGYQWILMKMFGLYLDSKHNKSNKQYENLGRDTNLIIPDLNNAETLGIGINPNSYTEMTNDISADHFVQGFMIGNMGSGEDGITTKNTDYSFMKLRNPIPFQQTQTTLASDIAGQYLGKLRMADRASTSSFYIKKFDDTPHIYHSWWKDGQRWDYIDAVTPNDLGPNATNGLGKTNRIETYAECKLTLNEDDCISYFTHNNETAIVNELGLVSYDTIPGTRSIIERTYNMMIKDFIKIIFDNNRTSESITELIALATNIYSVISQLAAYKQTHINSFIDVVNEVSGLQPTSEISFASLKRALSNADNIGVEAFYNQNQTLIYTTDHFLEYMSDDVFNGNQSLGLKALTTDEAQRIKLITYYTFKSIPLQSNWRIFINYRIYAN